MIFEHFLSLSCVCLHDSLLSLLGLRCLYSLLLISHWNAIMFFFFRWIHQFHCCCCYNSSAFYAFRKGNDSKFFNDSLELAPLFSTVFCSAMTTISFTIRYLERFLLEYNFLEPRLVFHIRFGKSSLNYCQRNPNWTVKYHRNVLSFTITIKMLAAPRTKTRYKALFVNASLEM